MPCLQRPPAVGAQRQRGLLRHALTLLALWFCLWPGFLVAQEPPRQQTYFTVKSWDVRDGLPHDMVQSIAQDRDGLLWLATWEGVARFNAQRFSVPDTSAIPGLRSRGFRAVYRDADGSLLLGSARNGVWRLSNGEWQAINAAELGNARVNTVLRGRDGSLWIGTERDVLQLDRANRLRQRYGPAQGLPESEMFQLQERPDGRIWLATSNGLMELDPAQQQVRSINHYGIPADSMVRALMRSREHIDYVGTTRGVFRLDGQRFTPLPAPLDKGVTAMLQGSDGALWFMSRSDGLLRLHQGQIDIIGARKGLIGHGTNALAEDSEGLIWAGTMHGLFRVSTSPASGLTPADGLSGDYSRTTFASRDGAVYIGGGSGRGLDRYKDGRLTSVAVPWPHGRPATIFGVAENSEGIWLGTSDNGLIRLPDQAGGQALNISTEQGLPSAFVRALLGARDGGLWVGTSVGLVYRGTDGRLRHFNSEDGYPEVVVHAIYEQADGRLWLGIGNAMYVREPDGRLHHYDQMSRPALPANTVFDFLDTGNGELWIASDAGLIRKRGERFTVYDQRHGLRNLSLFRLLQDARGDLWMSSNRGVFHIPIKQFDEIDSGLRQQLSVDVYDESNGLPSNQANGNSYPAGAITADGMLWIPNAAGVGIIDTNAAPLATPQTVPVMIEELRINGTAQAMQGVLQWASSQVRRITIDYAGLSFRHVGNLKYRYRLEHFDTDWIMQGDATQAVYTNLPPGQYQFRVQALPQQADWSRAEAMGGIGEARLSFELKPPLWQRAWFIAAAAAFVLLALATIWGIRSRNFRRQQARLSQMVDARTRELREKNDELETVVEERTKLMHRLELIASRDELTDLPNRRAGRQRLSDLCEGDAPIHVAMLDMDEFKQVNDRYGHEAGDRVLRAFARHLLAHADSPADCARLGGEEFVLLLPGMRREQALARCEQLRRAVETSEVLINDDSGQTLHCTVSIGVSSSGAERSPDVLLRQADEQLYRAKHLGRNRICVAE